MGMPATYHTHTYRCGHALGDVYEYADVAAAAGCPAMGVTDHVPLPDGRWYDVRMHMAEVASYVGAARRAQREHPDMRILLGFEADWVPIYASFYAEDLLGRIGCDYLLGSVHWFMVDGNWGGAWTETNTSVGLRAYADQVLQAIGSGLFAGICHPDTFGAANATWNADCEAATTDICQAARDANVPLELNSHGIRKAWVPDEDNLRPAYPWVSFWEVAAREGASVFLGSDAHMPEDTLAGMDDLTRLATELQLPVIDLQSIAHGTWLDHTHQRL